jgi:hypothetical protein
MKTQINYDNLKDISKLKGIFRINNKSTHFVFSYIEGYLKY